MARRVRLVVLSRSSRIASTRRLIDAAEARGHQVRCIDPVTLQLQLGPERGRLVRNFKRLKTPDLVVNRSATQLAPFVLPMLEQFEAQGAVVLDRADAVGASRNLLRCLQRLSSCGLPVMRTVLARDVRALKALVSRVGGLPVVVRVQTSGDGPRAMVCESMQSLEASLEAVLGLGHDVVMQECVRLGQQSLEVIVVGGQVTAAVQRVFKPGRAARNLGDVEQLEPIERTAAIATLATKAAKACSLEVCSVELVQTKRGLKVASVSSCPALPQLEAVASVDVSTAIIAHGESLVAARNARPKMGES